MPQWRSKIPQFATKTQHNQIIKINKYFKKRFGDSLNAGQGESHLRRPEAPIASPGVAYANQGASCYFRNLKLSMTQLNASVQVLCDSLLCFRHKVSPSSGFWEHQLGHQGVSVGEAEWWVAEWWKVFRNDSGTEFTRMWDPFKGIRGMVNN